uniref:Glutaredoxin domain-containing protein n=1 Tax=Strigamia maritima TaxID=126957 RepID=T1JAV3_STRMM
MLHERAPDTMGGGGTDAVMEHVPVARGISDERLRQELMQMFDDTSRPKLKPVAIKWRQFLHTSSGKVLCSTPSENCRNQTCKCHTPTKKQPAIIRRYYSVTDEELCDKPDCWRFHLRERDEPDSDESDASVFAGCQGVAGPESAIWSKDGTLRGVTNRVRAGIATFLHPSGQSKLGQENGHVVVYISSLGIIRETFQKCLSVRSILSTLLIHYDERDVYLNKNHQGQLMDRLGIDKLTIPHVFVGGHHLGTAQDIERLNESGQLRQIMKPYKNPNATTPCSKCGGYKLLPCSACQGTKKSARHRNTFTQEFPALRCMQCDERGLVKCIACCIAA